MRKNGEAGSGRFDGRSDFDRRVAARKAHLERTAEQARINKEQQERKVRQEQRRTADAMESKRARAALRLGTHPEVVWSSEKAQMCEEFLGYVASRGYPGSSTLEQPTVEKVKGLFGEKWKEKKNYSKGYYVANTSETNRRVYLCQDGNLRQETTVSTRNVLKSGVVEEISTDPETKKPYIPWTGYYALSMAETYVQPDSDEKHGHGGYYTRETVFYPVPLDVILENYALGIKMEDSDRVVPSIRQIGY